MISKKKNHILLIIMAFTTMGIFGMFMGGLRSLVNPLIQNDYNLTYSELGVLLGIFSAGSIFLTFFAGELIARFKLKKVFWLSMLVGGFSFLFLEFISTTLMLKIVMFGIGISFGGLNVSANSLASRVFTKNRGKMMNRFHLAFGIGGTLAPIYANYIFRLGFEWEKTYSFGIIIFFILFIYSMFCNFPRAEKEKKASDKNTFEVLKDKRVLIFLMLFLFLVGAELGMISWIGVYLKDVQSRSKEEIGFYTSMFFFFFSGGRLLASIFVEKIGYFKILKITLSSAIISFLLGLFGPNYFAFFLSLTGLFLSLNFPTIQAITYETFDSNIPKIIGLSLTAGSMGNIFLANWLIGVINDGFGLKIGFGLILIYMISFLMGLFYLEKNCKKECAE
ncbi:MAG: MFS transporter [Fusobacteriota bacterium]